MLKDMEKPSIVLTKCVEEVAAHYQQDGTLAPSAAPLTPMTPVSADAFISLQDLIVKQDAHALEELDRQKFGRHLQKFVKAAQITLARTALQEDRVAVPGLS